MGESVACCVGGDDSDPFCLDIEVYRGDEHLTRLRQAGHDTAFIAIGSNALRQRLGALARQLGYRLANAISPAAVISPSARLGNGIAIMAGAVINAESSIADLAIINTCASIDHDGRIGEAVHIAPHCALAGNVTVADRAFLGVGCKVIPGISIGQDVVAGAGSVIVRDIAPRARVAGIPAKSITRNEIK